MPAEGEPLVKLGGQMNLSLRKGGCASLLFLSSTFVIAQTTALPSSLAWWAQVAQERGQKAITLGTGETQDYTPPLIETLRQNLVLRGTVVEHTTDTSDGFKIRQFYKIHVLAQGPNRRPASTSSISVRPPSHFQGSSSDELILYTDGGTAIVDGVTITQPGPDILEAQKTYLFFLTRGSNGIYMLGFNTKPLLLDAQGNIDFTTAGVSKFVRQLRSAHSYSDLEVMAQRVK